MFALALSLAVASFVHAGSDEAMLGLDEQVQEIKSDVLGIAAELITRKDLGRLGEYDALFIRETTAVDHHTYLFARTAAGEGLVVIDDPDSILRCTNKIFLMELLHREEIPTPPSLILTRTELDRAEAELGYPLVLKIPDGSFSRGVFKANDRSELEEKSARLFEETELILAQAFVPTEFDWRIGVLAGEPLFACRYHMSRGHWQILNHQATGSLREGNVDTLPLEEVLRLHRETEEAKRKPEELPPPMPATIHRIDLAGRLLDNGIDLTAHFELVVLEGGVWVLKRPSGTEDIVKDYREERGETLETARQASAELDSILGL